jgi:hypothetical protein
MLLSRIVVYIHVIKIKNMAKTINSQIDIFSTFKQAEAAFNKSKVPCMLLEARTGWFIDRSKEAILDWPKNYKLIAEK